jgi:tRNA-uridine 2-sulfurtransferase
MSRPQTVVVAMSGGVDSSVTAALLVERGYRVIGVTMKTFCYSENAGPSRTCCGLDGIMDARRVCAELGVPHHVFDMEEAFTRSVIDDFVSEYAAGRTPNPCVNCNSNTKIPDLLRRARALGAEWIATGHYARIEHPAAGGPVLRRGADRAKDQTYFMWGVPPAVLPHLLFPVGELTKAEVRERARALGLATADKPESQEICFVPTGDYGEFLARRLGHGHAAVTPGQLVSGTGAVVGEHAGYGRYTVGQRRGLGGGRGRPLYVLRVVPEHNQVVVGSEDELYGEHVRIGALNWLGPAPAPGDDVLVQLRYRAPAVPATVEAAAPGELALHLVEPQRAITPGQSGVIYAGDRVLGGGRIHGTTIAPSP